MINRYIQSLLQESMSIIGIVIEIKRRLTRDFPEQSAMTFFVAYEVSECLYLFPRVLIMSLPLAVCGKEFDMVSQINLPKTV